MTSSTNLLAAWGLGLALLLAGCAPSPPDSEPTPVFSSEAEAFAAAEATYREYVKALNQVDLSDPETFEAVYAWTTGELNSSDRESFSAWYADSYQKVGSATIASVSEGTADVQSGRVSIDACYDVSEVDVRNAAGESVVDAQRPPVQGLHLSLSPSAATSTGLVLNRIEPAKGGAGC